MSTVHQTTERCNTLRCDANDWDSWTDADTWELGPGPDLDVAAWPEFDSPEPPDAASDLPGVFAAWAAWHKSEGDVDSWGAHQLLAEEVRTIGLVVAYGRHRTVAGYLACSYRYAPDLATLVVAPEGTRTSPLASALDDEARRYLAIGSDAARLVAWLCRDLANHCEEHGCHTVADYFDSLVDDEPIEVEYAHADGIEF